MYETRLVIEVVSPRREVLMDQTEDVVLPGLAGEMEVFPGHRPVLTALRPGRLVCTLAEGKRTFYLAGGFAEVLGDRIVVLADEAEDVTTIDLDEARERLARAREDLDAGRLLPVDQRAPLQTRVEQAQTRLRLAEEAARD